MSTLGRMVLLIWLFVVLIINSSYTASLTSILTVQQLSSPIKGVETLKTSDEPIGYQVGSFVENYLIKEIGIPKSRLVALGSPEEYATALQHGPKKGGVGAVVDERPYVELFLSSQCKFRIVGQDFTKGGWGFVSIYMTFSLSLSLMSKYLYYHAASHLFENRFSSDAIRTWPFLSENACLRQPLAYQGL